MQLSPGRRTPAGADRAGITQRTVVVNREQQTADFTRGTGPIREPDDDKFLALQTLQLQPRLGAR